MLAILRFEHGEMQVWPGRVARIAREPNEVARFLEMGASGVIAKPFDPMQLPQQVAQLWAAIHRV